MKSLDESGGVFVAVGAIGIAIVAFYAILFAMVGIFGATSSAANKHKEKDFNKIIANNSTLQNAIKNIIHKYHDVIKQKIKTKLLEAEYIDDLDFKNTSSNGKRVAFDGVILRFRADTIYKNDSILKKYGIDKKFISEELDESDPEDSWFGIIYRDSIESDQLKEYDKTLEGFKKLQKDIKEELYQIYDSIKDIKDQIKSSDNGDLSELYYNNYSRIDDYLNSGEDYYEIGGCLNIKLRIKIKDLNSIKQTDEVKAVIAKYSK